MHAGMLHHSCVCVQQCNALQVLLELEAGLQQRLGSAEVIAEMGEAMDCDFSPEFLLAPFDEENDCQDALSIAA